MKFSVIQPEVAGSLGPATVLDRTMHPPWVLKVEYVFEGWLGDPLLESFPTFIVTVELKDRLVAAAVRGLDFEDALISKGDQFAEVSGDRPLPSFVRLLPRGTAGQDDVGLAPDGRLVVSEAVLNICKEAGMKQALIDPYMG